MSAFKKTIPVIRYNPDINEGLTYEQINERRRLKLTNTREIKTTKSYTAIILQNVFTVFNLLWFLIAAILIFAKAYGDCFFLIIIFCNLFIGIIQEIKAKKTVEKLSLLTAPSAVVIRNMRQEEIPATDVVLDEILIYSMGKQICCDSIILSGSVEVNESMLTGESVPIKKGNGEYLYAGSYVSSGNCTVRAEHIGNGNYIQTLSKKAKDLKKPISQLLKSLKLLINTIAVLLVPMGVVVAWRNYTLFDGEIYSVITKTSGAIVGMIPSGMFLLTSMALAVGIVRLAKKRTLVQDLYCIEMLARTTVLCLDKTGTITDGTMILKDCIPLAENIKPVKDIISSILSATKDNNQTAMALINAYGNRAAILATAALPFSSARKISAADFGDEGTYAIGAAEYLFKDLPQETSKLINEYSVAGFRVVCIGHSFKHIEDEAVPFDMKPIYILLIEDHIREDAIDTIKWFKENGVKIKIISADTPITVSEIARRIGIENSDKYISLDKKSDNEVYLAARQFTVFGRVSPEQKAVLVKSLKAAGETVAMTGDGVNDILAMKEADCSVAMAAGSEAARNVSNLVLLDSNFSCMPEVVAEGRRVINNIQKTSAMFLMKTFFVIFLVLLLSLIPLTKYPYPFTPRQMMLLEILVIGTPAFFLALQPNRNLITGSFLPTVIKKSLPASLMLVFNILVLYAFGSVFKQRLGIEYEDIVTMCIYCTTFGGFIMLGKVCYPFNKSRLILLITMVSLSVLLLFILPDFFELTHLNIPEIAVTAGLVVIDVPLLLLLEFITNKIKIK